MDTQQVTRDNLSNVMDFDHVIEVHEDGTVTDAASAIWAPEVSVVGGDYRNPAIDAQSGRVWSDGIAINRGKVQLTQNHAAADVYAVTAEDEDEARQIFARKTDSGE